MLLGITRRQLDNIIERWLLEDHAVAGNRSFFRQAEASRLAG
jgi:hypothetical protein